MWLYVSVFDSFRTSTSHAAVPASSLTIVGSLMKCRSLTGSPFTTGAALAAVADEDEISVQPTVAVESASGFDRSVELVIGTDQGKRGGGSEELGVRSGCEKLVGVLCVQRLARRFAGRQRTYFDSPEAAGKIGGAEHRGNAIWQRLNGRGQQRRDHQKGNDNDTRNRSPAGH